VGHLLGAFLGAFKLVALRVGLCCGWYRFQHHTSHEGTCLLLQMLSMCVGAFKVRDFRDGFFFLLSRWFGFCWAAAEVLEIKLPWLCYQATLL